MYTYIHSFLDYFPIWAITEYRVEFPVLYSRALLVKDTWFDYVLLCNKSTQNLVASSTNIDYFTVGVDQESG